jgi:hypothetical protein
VLPGIATRRTATTGNVEPGSVETGNVETGNVETGSVETGNVETGNAARDMAVVAMRAITAAGTRSRMLQGLSFSPVIAARPAHLWTT